ncbi:WD40/YVTN/BNR-like repeat-containing protein [Hydrocarboniphaga effusa]|uniref:WD40/YVTN/BNR-like repeat-containing protein n=1 Tax=Hydrocarboniphaga effusa TaxID=243629 RepID=UPI0035B47A94
MSVIERGVRAACITLGIAGLMSAAYANTPAATPPTGAAPVANTPAPASSSNNPVVLQGTAHQALFGVAFDGDRGVAVGAMGELLESSDGGKSWKATAKGITPLSLLGVGLQGAHRIAVGQQGLILRSEGDAAWSKVESGSQQRLLAVSVNEAGLAASVGAFGAILVSDNGGQSWQPIQIDWTRYLEDPVDPHLYDVAVSDGGVITIAGEYGLILRSADHGKTWVSVHRGEASIFDIAMRPDGVGYAVGQNGLVMTSSDGGNTWRDLPTGSEAVLLNVWSAPDGRVIVAGMRETLESSDGGASWKRRTDGDFGTTWYSSIAAPASGGVVLVGHTGRIIRIDS